VALKVQEVD
jgi:hypothetical protein